MGSEQTNPHTSLPTLLSLRERVRALTGPDREVDGAIALLEGWTFQKMKGDRAAYWRRPQVTEWYMRESGGPPAYTDSVDACIALAERLLPGAEFELTNIYGVARASIPLNDSRYPASDGEHKGGSLALALLDAILSALIAGAQDHD